MDKLQKMEEQLGKYTGSIDEEGSAKFNEALDYVSTHLTPEVRKRMTIFVEEGPGRLLQQTEREPESCRGHHSEKPQGRDGDHSAELAAGIHVVCIGGTAL